MSELENQFQQHIDRLEAGENIQQLSQGLPDEEVGALTLVEALRTLELPEMAAENRAAQRDAVVKAGALKFSGLAARPPAPPLSRWERLLLHLRPPYTVQDFPVALAAVVTIAVITVTWLGIAQNRPVSDVVTESNPSENELTSAGVIDQAPQTAEPTEAESAEAPAVNQADSGLVGEAAVDSGAAAPAPGGEHTTFMPILSSALEMAPELALVDIEQGFVEIQPSPDAAWVPAGGAIMLAAGSRLRTGPLSQAAITFYDGSRAVVAPNSELSIDLLDAKKREDGFRQVVMTQWTGESDHEVQFRNDDGSLYEVKSPAGSGIARGTRFRVVVTPALLVRYIVTEGKVDVSGQNRTVAVIAGQRTTIAGGSAPAEPLFNIFGEGEVSAVGPIWTIAGQAFKTDDTTVIIGNPQVGDVVHVSGHLLPDGSRQADSITLIRRAIVNRFSLSGEVAVMGSMWEVAGQIIAVDDDTVIDEAIAIGDQVRISGLVLQGGTLQAKSIIKLETESGLPFAFTGIIEVLTGSSVTISGQIVDIDGETILPDDLEVGDVVAVSGRITGGRWLAQTIKRANVALATFEVTGELEAIEPWQVAGLEFEIRPWSIVSNGVAVGDRVSVRGTILPDGTRVADVIVALDEQPVNVLVLIGIVGGIDPWIINGIPVTVIGSTKIIGEIIPGSAVVVQIRLLPNGRWQVFQIEPLMPPVFGLGCLILSSPVIEVQSNKFKLKHWEKFIERNDLLDDLKINSVVTLPLCSGLEGEIELVGSVIVIYRPTVIIIDDGVDVVPPGCRFNSKGSLKCSNKSSRNKSSR